MARQIRAIDVVTKDGYRLNDTGGAVRDFALLSLRLSLKAYFSTYEAMGRRLNLFDPSSGETQDAIDLAHPSRYCEACTEAILHAQHFAELVIKDCLRNVSEILVLDASRRVALLYKLINGMVTDADYEGVNTVEFSEALSRLCELITKENLGAGQFQFILDARTVLNQLNTLRNRSWHRGTFILRYPALDEFMGKYILPFVYRALALPQYTNLEHPWKHGALTCGVEPTALIVDEFTGSTYDLKKVAFLKELGRAAYASPLPADLTMVKWYHEDINERRGLAEAASLSEIGKNGACEVRTCPVCGANALVIYDELEEGDFDETSESWPDAYFYTWRVRCLCCTFELDHSISNPSVYSLPIQDFWKTEKCGSK